MDTMLKAQREYALGAQTTPYNLTLRERLITQKADLTQRLANVDEAIKALDENPNFESVMNVIGRVNY